MTVFIGYSESLRMLYCDQSRLHGLISIALIPLRSAREWEWRMTSRHEPKTIAGPV